MRSLAAGLAPRSAGREGASLPRAIGHYERMLEGWSKRQRRVLTVIVLSAVVVLGDIIVLNVAGEVSSDWWIVAVPVGLLLVPVIGIVSLVALIRERRRS